MRQRAERVGSESPFAASATGSSSPWRPLRLAKFAHPSRASASKPAALGPKLSGWEPSLPGWSPSPSGWGPSLSGRGPLPSGSCSIPPGSRPIPPGSCPILSGITTVTACIEPATVCIEPVTVCIEPVTVCIEVNAGRKTLLIRLRDKIASHAERSSVTGGGGGRNGVEASRASRPSVRASPFHSTGSFTPRRPTTFPHRRCVQDDLRFFVTQPDQHGKTAVFGQKWGFAAVTDQK